MPAVNQPRSACLSLATMFERQVGRAPHAVALVHDGVPLTYEALNRRANQIAHSLQAAGVVPERRVAVCAERGFDLLAILLAVAKAGGAYVPLDPSFPAARLSSLLARSDAGVLITQKRLPIFATFAGESIVLDEHRDRIARQPASDLEPTTAPAHLAALLSTSGTTGDPKGILVSSSSVVALITGMWDDVPFRPGDRSLLHRSFTVIGSLWEYFGPLLHGVPSVILSGEDARDPSVIWNRVIEQHITHLVASPTLCDALSTYGERHGLHSHAMRVNIIGGEAVRAETVARWGRRFPRTTVLIGYGMTEAIYVAFFNASAGATGRQRLPVGVPFGAATVRIVDDAMQLAEEGRLGEVCVSGPGVARGYLRAPGLTAARFVADPWGRPGSVLYRTGDLGRWDADGLLEVHGRRDRQVKIRGFRVELDEIEAAILRAAPVRRVAVVARADAQGRPRLLAYVEADTTITAEDLRRALRDELPPYMLPSIVVRVDAMPLTASGKSDRRSLPQPPERAALARSTRV
jgi:amino acid adenylation domain-containing protein